MASKRRRNSAHLQSQACATRHSHSRHSPCLLWAVLELSHQSSAAYYQSALPCKASWRRSHRTRQTCCARPRCLHLRLRAHADGLARPHAVVRVRIDSPDVKSRTTQQSHEGGKSTNERVSAARPKPGNRVLVARWSCRRNKLNFVQRGL